jgi:hypothetical protein
MTGGVPLVAEPCDQCGTARAMINNNMLPKLIHLISPAFDIAEGGKGGDTEKREKEKRERWKLRKIVRRNVIQK